MGAFVFFESLPVKYVSYFFMFSHSSHSLSLDVLNIRSGLFRFAFRDKTLSNTKRSVKRRYIGLGNKRPLILTQDGW